MSFGDLKEKYLFGHCGFGWEGTKMDFYSWTSSKEDFKEGRIGRGVAKGRGVLEVKKLGSNG